LPLCADGFLRGDGLLPFALRSGGASDLASDAAFGALPPFCAASGAGPAFGGDLPPLCGDGLAREEAFDACGRKFDTTSVAGG